MYTGMTTSRASQNSNWSPQMSACLLVYLTVIQDP